MLGTTLEVQILATGQAQAIRAQQALLAEIDRLELIFSRFLPHSELNRWLKSSGPVSVSAELGQVLQQALIWKELSGGAFHPATEALSLLWKAAEVSGVPPEVSAVLDEMAQPLYTVQEQAGQHGQVSQWTAERHTHLPLGFNAFAKGFIADLSCEAALAAAGVSQVVVNIGGDLRVLGPRGVRVDIADPFTLADNAAPIAGVRVQNMGAATSGRARRGFLVGGVWHSHVLDPRSGQPAGQQQAGQVISASVVAGSSASADVLATIFSVLGPADSLRLTDSLAGVACLLVDHSGQQYRNALWTQLETDAA